MEEKKELLDQDERVVEIELERLRGFVNHPFKVQADSQMIELQDKQLMQHNIDDVMSYKDFLKMFATDEETIAKINALWYCRICLE